VQIPILRGVYSAVGPDFEKSFPLNLEPFAEETGISEGYLRSTPGITGTTTGQGRDGGGINWNDTLYRISGTKLIKVAENGDVTVLGTVGGVGQGSLALSFDKLAVSRNEQLWYVEEDDTFTQVTDADLGIVLDVIWMDGYFVTIDEDHIVVTELNDPTQVDPLKYGSAEEDPDTNRGLLKVRGELVVFGAHWTEFFDNIGGTGFPFLRNRSAAIPKGIVGTHAKCEYNESFAFVGGGRDEMPRVWYGGQGEAVAISDKTIDRILGAMTAEDLSEIVLESRVADGQQKLYVHLPDQTFVYSLEASRKLGVPVWFKLASGTDGASAYRGRNFVYVYDAWHCGDALSSALGTLDKDTTDQFGNSTSYLFDAAMVYSEGKGAQCHALELVGHYGRAPTGTEPRMFMSWTDDGLTYSQERAHRTGFTGQRSLRVAWRRNGFFRQWRTFRFRGVSSTPISFQRLEAELEPLNG